MSTFTDWYARYQGRPTSPAVEKVVSTYSSEATVMTTDDGLVGTMKTQVPLEFIYNLLPLAPQGHGGVVEAIMAGWKNFVDTSDYDGHRAHSVFASAMDKALLEVGGLVDEDTVAKLFADASTVTFTNTTRSPDVGRRTDGTGLIYTRTVNMIYGPPETGKSIMASAIARQTLDAGDSVIWIDLDHNGAADTLGRLEQIGIERAVLEDRSRFLFAEPQGREEFESIVQYVGYAKPTLVVVDSMGELQALYGVFSEQDGIYAQMNTVSLAAMASFGSAVLVIDHVPKGGSNADYSLGSQRKKSALDGSMLRVKLASNFIPGSGGSAKLSISKDRPGGLRAGSPSSSKEQTAAVFAVGKTLSDFSFTVPQPSPEEQAGTPGERKTDLELLQGLDPAPSSVADVKARLTWGSSRASAALKAYRETLIPS